MSKTRKLVYLAVLLSIAIMLHVFEGYLPNPFLFPGAKLGLANVVTLVTIVLFGVRFGLLLAVVRSLTGSLLGGTFLTFGFFMSFAGALVSGLMMALVYTLWRKQFSLIGISIFGAICHNLAQLTVASIWANQVGLFVYLPYLLFFAIPTGFFNGVAAKTMLKAMPGHLASGYN